MLTLIILSRWFQHRLKTNVKSIFSSSDRLLLLIEEPTQTTKVQSRWIEPLRI